MQKDKEKLSAMLIDKEKKVQALRMQLLVSGFISTSTSSNENNVDAKKIRTQRRATIGAPATKRPLRKSYGGALGFEKWKKDIMDLPLSNANGNQGGTTVMSCDSEMPFRNFVDGTCVIQTASENKAYDMPPDQTRCAESVFTPDSLSCEKTPKHEVENELLRAEIARLETLLVETAAKSTSSPAQGIENPATTRKSDDGVNKRPRKRNTKSVRFFESPVQETTPEKFEEERITTEPALFKAEINSTANTPLKQSPLRDHKTDCSTAGIELDRLISCMQVDCFDIKARATVLQEELQQTFHTSPLPHISAGLENQEKTDKDLLDETMSSTLNDIDKGKLLSSQSVNSDLWKEQCIDYEKVLVEKESQISIRDREIMSITAENLKNECELKARMNEIEELRNKLSEDQKRNRSNNELVEEVGKLEEKLNNERQMYTKTLEEKEETIDSLRAPIEKKDNEISNLKLDLVKLNELVEQCHNTIKENEQISLTKDEKMRGLEDELKMLQVLSKTNDAHQIVLKENAKVKENEVISQLKLELDAVKSELQSLLNIKDYSDHLKNEITALKEQLKDHNEIKEKMALISFELEEKELELENVKTELQRLLDTKDYSEQLKNEYHDLKEQLKDNIEVKEKLSLISSELEEKKLALENVKTKLQCLLDMKDYFENIKNENEWLKGQLDDHSEVQEKISLMSSELAEKKSALQSYAKEIDETRKKINLLEKEKQSLIIETNDLRDRNKIISEKEEAILMKDEEIKKLECDVKGLTELKDEFQNTLVTNKKLITDKDEIIRQLKHELEDLKNERQNLLAIKDYCEDLKNENKGLMEQLNDQSKVKESLTSMAFKLEEKSSILHSFTVEIEEAKKQMEVLENEKEALMIEVKEMRNILTEEQRQNKSYSNEVLELKKQQEKIIDEINVYDKVLEEKVQMIHHLTEQNEMRSKEISEHGTTLVEAKEVILAKDKKLRELEEEKEEEIQDILKLLEEKVRIIILVILGGV